MTNPPDECRAAFEACPFCGEPPIVCEDDWRSKGYLVACDNRACPAEPVVEGEDRSDAARRWNTRRPEPDPAEAVNDGEETDAVVLALYEVKNARDALEHIRESWGGDAKYGAMVDHLRHVQEPLLRASDLLNTYEPEPAEDAVSTLAEQLARDVFRLKHRIHSDARRHLWPLARRVVNAVAQRERERGEGHE